MSATPRLVVGLGNPGPEYAATRHNVGFLVLDQLAERWSGSFKRKWRFQAVVAEVIAPGTGAEKILLAKPQTYMNESGRAVAALAGWRKLEPERILIVVDDADLPLGEVRLRTAGGSGGHHGLESVLAALGGTETVPRVRVGIGRTAAGGADITGHVLGRFAAAEREAADQAIERAAAAVACCVSDGLAVAMNRFNRRGGGSAPASAT